MSEMLERTPYRTEVIVMTHTGEYAEDDQSLTPIDLRRSTVYCII